MNDDDKKLEKGKRNFNDYHKGEEPPKDLLKRIELLEERVEQLRKANNRLG